MTHFPSLRHCEEPQATRQSMAQFHGLLRFARNDEGVILLEESVG